MRGHTGVGQPSERSRPAFVPRRGLSGLIPRRMSSVVLPILVLFLFILVSAALRPVLPPDETRYLTVAWEMFLKGDFIVPTFNFTPYNHKPPLLFWLIDVSWALFGVSRLAALAVIFGISSTSIVLTRRLAHELFPDDDAIAERIGWVMLGNAVFVIYSGLILFDLLLTCCVLGALLALLVNARQPGGRSSPLCVVAAGLCLGLGVLAKGPVVLIFVVWPVVTHPLWRGEHDRLSVAGMWMFIGAAILIALLPIAAWVVPALIQTNGEFARSLIWDQTAGRVSGTMTNSHDRPFWFYLPLLPIFAMPWIFSPYAWRAHRGVLSRPLPAIRNAWRTSPSLRFLVLWIVPVVATFSLIGGKQPHYLVPILPAAVVLAALAMRTLSMKLIRIGVAIMLGLAIVGQAIASLTAFKGYDLQPLADLVSRHDGPVAFAGNYQGDFGFLGRLKKPLEIIEDDQAAAWLAAHPQGMVAAVRLRPDETLPGRTVFDARYELDRRMAASVNNAAASGDRDGERSGSSGQKQR